MKKLIALLAIVGFTPIAHAADGADATHSGEFRLQYTSENNYTDTTDSTNDRDQDMAQRLRWGTSVRAGEKLTGTFTLVHNANWGTNPDQIPGAGGAGATTDNNTLIVNEAFMTWLASDAWLVKAGRGTHTMGDGRFVSSNDFDAIMRAFDGVMTAYDHEMARFSFFHVTGAKDTAGNSGANNNFGRFFGVAIDLKSLPEVLKMANLHVVQVKRDYGTYGIELGPQVNMKIGAMVAGEAGGVDFRLNYEMEDGEETSTAGNNFDISTSMIDAEVGYNYGSGRVHFGYHTDSGTSSGTDDETYDGFHYDRHNNAGQMDVLGWGNLTYMRVGLLHNVNDDMSFGAEYFMFTQTEKNDVSYGYNGQLAGSLVDLDGEDELGSELDVWVTKKYTSNFSITARYGMFQVGDEFGSNPDDLEQFFVESKLTF